MAPENFPKIPCIGVRYDDTFLITFASVLKFSFRSFFLFFAKLSRCSSFKRGKF